METLSATAFADKIIMARQKARIEHERIFGKPKQTFRELGMMCNNLDSRRFMGTGDATITMQKVKATVKGKVRRGSKRKKKELCPHCATKNFIKVDVFTHRCTKCRYER